MKNCKRFILPTYAYLALFILAFIFSCTKPGEISGKLLTYGSEVPVYDALIKIYEFIPSGEWGTSGSYRFLDSTRTDINGRYYFSDIEKEMYATIEKEKFFPIWRTGDLTLFKDIPSQKIYLDAESYMCFKFLDVEEIEGSFVYFYYSSDFSYNFNINENTTIDATLVANKFNAIFYNINSQGVIQDSVKLNTFENDTITINF